MTFSVLLECAAAPPGTGTVGYAAAFSRVAIPALDAFQPLVHMRVGKASFSPQPWTASAA